MMVVGIDPSLASTGVYYRCIEEKTFKREEAFLIKTDPKKFVNRFERYKYIETKLVEKLPIECDLVAIEGYSLASRGSAVSAIVENGFNIRRYLYHNRVPFMEVAPQTVKAYATGQAFADKERVAEAARKTMRKSFLDQLSMYKRMEVYDIVDAYVLAQIAFCRLTQVGDERIRKMCSKPDIVGELGGGMRL